MAIVDDGIVADRAIIPFVDCSSQNGGNIDVHRDLLAVCRAGLRRQARHFERKQCLWLGSGIPVRIIC
jgi:hypothetical protein